MDHTFDGGLEIRQRGAARVLAGSFPLGRTATIRSSGRVRKERFARGRGGVSVSWQYRRFQELQRELSETISATIDESLKMKRIEALEDEILKRNSHFLIGHSYDRPVADTLSGNLSLAFSDDAVEILATLPAEEDMPTWTRDLVLSIRNGQKLGISPGFQVPAKGAERFVKEEGGDALIREIEDSVVFEWSAVSRPAYSGTEVDARADDSAVHGGESPHAKGAYLWL